MKLTITPESVVYRYRLTCNNCEMGTSSNSLDYLKGYGESHAFNQRHTVEIEDTQPEPETNHV